MITKKYYFLYLVAFFIFLGVTFFFIPKREVFSLELNIDYPTTPTGINLTPQSSVPEYFKYVFDFGMFVGIIAVIISLTIAGVYYFLSPAIPSALAKAKDRIYGAISGLLILLLLYLIITTINPNLAFFYLEPLKPIDTSSQEPPPQPGVYLYETNNCTSPPEPSIKTHSVSDLKDQKNKITSAKIIHDYKTDTYYLSILYESLGFWGKCFVLNPNAACNENIVSAPSIAPSATPAPFASSVAVYEYNRYPSAGKVTLYHETFYNSKGGSLSISDSEINGIYFKTLKNLNFMSNQNGNPTNPDNCTVPKEKMDCIQWDDKGACTKRKCPDLTGENIGSIKIEGNYVVMLIYFGPEDKSKGPWSLCQSFPAPDDKIRMGPNKIDWENIKNKSRLPNYIAILRVINNSNPDQ